MKSIMFAVTVVLILPLYSCSLPTDKTPVFQTQPRKIAAGFKFAEGPAADKNGNIYFTDILNNRIHKWSTSGKLSVFVENTHMSNGLYFDHNGNLIACAGGAGKLLSIDPKGNVTTLADNFEGKPFNSPNDLWIDPKGGIYFTDPRYFGGRENLPQPGEYVYYISPNGKEIKRVIDDLVRPNGLAGTPDGKILYVADQGGNKTWVYRINSDATVTDKKLFADQTCDGMTIDECGNVYLTIKGVNIYSPSGKLLKSIDLPKSTTNVCFSGTNNRTLFITTRNALYSMKIASFD